MVESSRTGFERIYRLSLGSSRSLPCIHLHLAGADVYQHASADAYAAHRRARCDVIRYGRTASAFRAGINLISPAFNRSVRASSGEFNLDFDLPGFQRGTIIGLFDVFHYARETTYVQRLSFRFTTPSIPLAPARYPVWGPIPIAPLARDCLPRCGT